MAEALGHLTSTTRSASHRRACINLLATALGVVQSVGVGVLVVLLLLFGLRRCCVQRRGSPGSGHFRESRVGVVPMERRHRPELPEVAMLPLELRQHLRPAVVRRRGRLLRFDQEHRADRAQFCPDLRPHAPDDLVQSLELLLESSGLRTVVDVQCKHHDAAQSLGFAHDEGQLLLESQRLEDELGEPWLLVGFLRRVGVCALSALPAGDGAQATVLPLLPPRTAVAGRRPPL
mmetsp:Transcript_116557/g.334604  ORF Transcript_116557/g.334604 Transcript_116557/m.334604 type:complete len:233 (+) Transcript_116557:696-1394(+)